MKELGLCYFLVLSILFLACQGQESTVKKNEGLELAYMDTTVRPQDDFYRFANGRWLDITTIPPDKGSWGNFDAVYENNNKVLLDVLSAAAENPDYIEGSDHRKAADFYTIGMDSLLAERWGVGVLTPVFDQIGKITNAASLQDYLVAQELEGGGAFFALSIFSDFKSADRVAVYLQSGGLGLPERDYYLKTDEKSLEIRAKYRSHIANMLVLAGENPTLAGTSADQILDIETQLAKATLTKEESRDPQRLYNKMAVGDLRKLLQAIDWPAYFKGLAIGEDSIIVEEPAFMAACQRIYGSGKWTSIQYYLKWTALREAAPYLSHAFVKGSFDFKSKYLRGVDQLQPRWKRVMGVTDSYLGEAIGQLYVKKVFPEEAKRKAVEMVGNIKLAMADRIKQLDWMSDSTKRMALKKLSALKVKIGYPDEWKSYAGLLVEKSPQASYYQNVVHASRWTVQQSINKLGKPVNRNEWEMTPQTVNAYYHPLLNEIVFPAGILQPPFFNYQADEAVNYGAIGGVIGHEISHGFDDQGSQFDAEGNLKNWWAEEDLKHFKSKSQVLVEQFNAYEVLPGVFVQGQFTLGENIGDLAGINIAYEGLQRYMRENGRPGLIDGYTPEQRFFISWATAWRAKIRDESLRTQVNTDPHAPDLCRAVLPLTNLASFYETFDLKPGDKLYRSEGERVKIW